MTKLESVHRMIAQEAQIVVDHEAAQVAADAESRGKDEFLAMLARELGKPLTPIRLAMLTIRGQAERDPAVQQAKDVVERQVESLRQVLDALLDVLQLRREKVELRKQSTTLQTIVTAALESTLGLADARRHRVSVSLPVDPLDLAGGRYLVCARGNSNWVRNARTAGEIVLVRAMRRHRYAVSELSPSLRPPILKAYLDHYATEVQRFFPVPKGSPVEAFNDLAPRYPVFELQPLDETAHGTGASS